MIRRRVGSSFYLITQDDHAHLAGQLARHLGTSRYPRSESFDEFVAAVDLHDAGWPVHDNAPTLNAEGFPLHVFETPRELGIRVWAGAPPAAATCGPWSELLVSLHILTLSANASARAAGRPTDSIPARFEMNKFQHREIERQEILRRRLGLSTDVPLTLGLTDENDADPQEALLRCHLRWLQAMDALSLALCCDDAPFPQVHIHPTPGALTETLQLRRERDDLLVSPWPFAAERIDVEIPYMSVPARRYADNADLHAELARAPRGTLAATVRFH